MSAYVLGNDHIDLLVSAVQLYRVDHAYATDPSLGGAGLRHLDLRTMSGDDLGRMLLQENVNSVLYRYSQSADEEEAADYFRAVETYRHRIVLLPQPAEGLTPIGIIKACHSYAYQACEHPGWASSDAKAVVDALEGELIRKIPGYDEARTWSYQRPAGASTITRII